MAFRALVVTVGNKTSDKEGVAVATLTGLSSSRDRMRSGRCLDMVIQFAMIHNYALHGKLGEKLKDVSQQEVERLFARSHMGGNAYGRE